MVQADAALIVEDLFDGAPRYLEELIAGGDELLARVRDAAVDGRRWHPLADVASPPPCSLRPSILAIGLNYAAHSSELGLKTDSTPTVFVLWPNSLAGHDATTTWPRSLSESVDYEAELGVIIGTPAKDVAPEDALDHVWGYTVVNDITARDIQYSEAQWSRCKSFDGFTPTGPFVVTADEVPDPQDLHIWTVLDGTDAAGRRRPARWSARSRRSSRTCRSRRRCCLAPSSRPAAPAEPGTRATRRCSCATAPPSRSASTASARSRPTAASSD